jgi:hypothetical protein
LAFANQNYGISYFDDQNYQKGSSTSVKANSRDHLIEMSNQRKDINVSQINIKNANK